MIHVYALTDAGAETTEELPLGIGDRALELRSAGPVAAVLSRHDEAPDATAEALLRHASVVEALAAHRAVLPARFGAGVPDERAVDDLLAQPGLVTRLDGVRDRVEVDVRLVASAPGAAAATPAPAAGSRDGRSGRDHLRALAARSAAAGSSERARQLALDAIRTRLESAAQAVVDRPPGSPRVLRHIALLLDRDALPGFGRAVAELADELAPAHTVLCTGPWPPYNFVDDAALPSTTPHTARTGHEVAG